MMEQKGNRFEILQVVGLLREDKVWVWNTTYSLSTFSIKEGDDIPSTFKDTMENLGLLLNYAAVRMSYNGSICEITMKETGRPLFAAMQEVAQEAIQLPLALESDGALEEAAAPESEPMPDEAPESDAPLEEASEPEAEPETEPLPDEVPESNDPQGEAAPEAEPEDEPLPDEAPESDGPTEITVESEAPLEGQAAFTIEVPLEGFTDTQLLNIEKLIASKASLIKKSFGVEELPIVKDEDRLAFPWFHRELTSFEIQTYTHFIAALCKVAKTQTRVTAKDKDVPSERFTFRIFLLKLGFAGRQYADERKLLYTNLSGDCAFPTTAKRDEHAARWSDIRKQRRVEQRSNQADADTANTEALDEEQEPEAQDEQPEQMLYEEHTEIEPELLNEEAMEDAV